MINSSDKATTDLFPVKKSRGRPATGKAKTAAERQAAYRIRKNDYEDKKNLNIWINSGSMLELKRIAKHMNIEPAELIEKLLSKEHNKIIKTLNNNEKWNNYFDTVTNNDID